MNRIAVLPPGLAQKIAAGEVIENPVSVVKELVENAIDAGAETIAVDLLEGGKALVRVRDDGWGMSRADAELAFVRHATSKVSREEDLLAVRTLGFRGEALASVAAVSRLTLRTSEGEGSPGTLIEREAETVLSVRDIAFPRGTEIEVRDLFFNLPARRAFLRSAAAELRRIVLMMTHAALARPGLRIEVRHGERAVLSCPPVGSLRERLFQLRGGDALDRLMEVDLAEEPLRVWGFASRPPYGRTDRTGQVMFVNRRPVRDKTLSAALAQAYAGLLEKGLSPEAVLFLELPSGEVDVNVHPAKSEVRFRETSAVFRLVLRAVEKARTRALGVLDLDSTLAGKTDRPAGSGTPSAPGFLDFRVSESGKADFSALPASGERFRVLGQLAGAYILAEDGGDLLIVDQHNAHERVLYDRFVEIDRTRAWPTAMSLVPGVFDLDPAEALGFEEAAETLGSMGFRVEPMGGRSFALREYPDVFGPEEALKVVREAASGGRVAAGGPPLRDRLLATMACKSAVKAGEPLPREKMEFLVRELFRSSNPGVCPHGRPIVVRVDRDWIDRGMRRPASGPSN